jgi:iron(II)-dependent oxidoreductase
MAKFFMTHSWHDIVFVDRLYRDLSAHGLGGFLDKYAIKPGDKVSKEIQTGLEACEIYLPVMSYAALKSDWCDEEIHAALTLHNTAGRNHRPQIIPILIEDCRVALQKYSFLLTRLYIDFTQDYDAELEKLLRALGAAPNPKSAAPPPTDPPKPKPAAPIQTDPSPPAPALPQPDATPSLHAPALSRDELAHLFHEARALQTEGDLRGALMRLTQIVNSAPDYRDAHARFQKLQLYLQADDLIQKSLAAQDDRVEPWAQARAALEALLKLDPQFLDAPAKLQTTQHWIALSEIYEHLLDVLENDDWTTAYRLFEQIRSVKPNYKRTQTLFERAWAQMVQAGVTKKIGKDGREMLLVPAGEFVMGEGNDAHPVYLDAFYISRYPVTNAEYKKFVDTTKHSAPQHWSNGQIPAGKEKHPVTNVTWDDANAYAQWAGTRLPTEAEWEKAASWDDAKKVKRVFPWGDTFDANKCNSAESKIGDMTPVAKYSPQGESFYGIADMAGNVWEWCADWYDENYYNNSPARNPTGPSSGQVRVLRGGSWYSVNDNARGACRFRNNPDFYNVNVSFRVVVSSSLNSEF